MDVMRWLSVIIAVGFGIWLLTIAVGIKLNRRSMRKAGKDEVYANQLPVDGKSDPAEAYDYPASKPFDPDDVELVIFDSEDDSPAESSASKP